MPYDTISDAKKDGFITKINDADLTIGQINWLADLYDKLKKEGKVENPMSVAISQFKKKYRKEGDRWVEREKLSSELQEIEQDESWVEILREGKWKDVDLVVKKENLDEIKKNFDNKVLGVDVAIDIEHRPEGGAYGWVRRLEVVSAKDIESFLRSENYDEEKINNFIKSRDFKDDVYVLLGLVEWNDRGKELLKDKVYKYMSAEIDLKYKNNETGDEHGWVLVGVALTNRPVIKGQAEILLSEEEKEVRELKEKIEKLLSEYNAKIEEIANEYKKKLQEIQAPEEATKEAMPEKSILEMTEDEIKELTLQETLELVGRILANTEYWEGLSDEDKANAKAKLISILNNKIGDIELSDEEKIAVENVKERLEKVALSKVSIDKDEFEEIKEVIQRSIEEKKMLSELLRKEKDMSMQIEVEKAIRDGVPPKYRKLLSEMYLKDKGLFDEFVKLTKVVNFSELGSAGKSDVQISEIQRKVNQILGIRDEVFLKYAKEVN